MISCRLLVGLALGLWPWLGQAQTHMQRCDRLQDLQLRCERQLSPQLVSQSGTFLVESSQQVFLLLKSELREPGVRGCAQLKEARGCSLRLAKYIRSAKFKSSPYKISSDAGLRSFGVELLNSVEPASKKSNRSPASR